VTNDVNFVNNEVKTPVNSAYVRVKVFKKPVVAKMLVDSGNLVHDLISEEFAKKIGVQYRKINKKVGTAAQGGTVNIVGRSEPIRLFIENIAKPVIIEPYVVKDLSHPINVGRNFLGRYKGRLEYSLTAGYLEVNGNKTKLVVKNEPLYTKEVTDQRFVKIFQYPLIDETLMIRESVVSHSKEDIPIKNKKSIEIPGHSGIFVAFTTEGKVKLSEAMRNNILVETNVLQDSPVVVLPGVCKVIDQEAFCFVVNPEMQRVKLESGTLLGHINMIRSEEIAAMESETKKQNSEKVTPELYGWVREQLKVDKNDLLRNKPGLSAELVELFVEYEDAISKHDFDYGHTTAIQCQIQLKAGEEEPIRLKARPLNPAQEESMK